MPVTIEETVSEGVGLDEALPVGIDAPIANGIGVLGAPNVGMYPSVSEGIGVDADWPTAARVVNVAGGIGLAGGPPTYAYRPGVTISSGIGIDDASSAAQKIYPSLSESVRASGSLLATWPISVAGGIGVAGSLAISHGKVVIEQLRLSAALGVKSTRYLTVAQGIGLNDVAGRFFGMAIGEGIGLASSATRVASFKPSIAQGIGLSETLSKHFVVRVDANEGIGVDENAILNQIFWNAQINEGIKISAAYIQDGTITTWAVNTRTGAVSEYTNYAFNSFAKLGRNRFVAASSEGIYELDGPDDDGTLFTTKIRSGFAQFGTTRLTSLAGAYLGLHGTGNFLFKVITGTGEVRVYQINATSMRSTKVRIAKGIRTRYIAFELESVGQEFDLDTVEFVPIVAKRRV